MNLDISFAEFLLTLVAFVLGTITPVIYRRFFYEGISVRQPFDLRVITQEDSQKQQNEILFSTIVKIANAGKDTVLLDEIEVSSIDTHSITFRPIKVELKFYQPGNQIYLPPSTSPDNSLDYLPLLIKADQERIIALGVHFRYSHKDISDESMKLAEYIENNGLKVSIRINGKYRNYLLKIKKFEG